MFEQIGLNNGDFNLVLLSHEQYLSASRPLASQRACFKQKFQRPVVIE